MSIPFTIIYEHAEDGWWVATIPEVPGVVSQGHTRSEAREMVLDALQELNLARRESALREAGTSPDTEKLELAS